MCILYVSIWPAKTIDTEKSSAFTNRTSERNGKLPLPISKRLFEHIIQVFNLSTSFLTVLNTGLATYTSTVHAKRREDGTRSNIARKWNSLFFWGEIPLINTLEFIIQQNRAYSAFSIAVSFNLRTGKTGILIFGVEPLSASELFAHLQSILPQAYGPMTVPAVAMELQAQSFSLTIKNCHESIHSIETATGMRQFNYPHERKSTSTQDWRSLDLIAITRELSSFLSRFAFLKMQAETGAYLIQQMAGTTKILIERMDKDRILFDTDDQYDIISKLEHIQSWYLGIAARCRYLSERTNAQSQTVSLLSPSRRYKLRI